MECFSVQLFDFCNAIFKPQDVALMGGLVCWMVGWSVGPYVFKEFLKLWKGGLMNTI